MTYAVLIEADRIDTFGEKAAAIGIDEPEYAIALGHAEEAASAEILIGNPPILFFATQTPATEHNGDPSHGPAGAS